VKVGLPIFVKLSSDSVGTEGDSGNGLDKVGKDFSCKVNRDVGLRVGEEVVVSMVIDRHGNGICVRERLILLSDTGTRGLRFIEESAVILTLCRFLFLTPLSHPIFP